MPEAAPVETFDSSLSVPAPEVVNLPRSDSQPAAPETKTETPQEKPSEEAPKSEFKEAPDTDLTVTFDDFTSLLRDGVVPEKKVEQKKEEPKVEKDKVETPAAQTQQHTTIPEKVGRDYSDFSEQEVAVLKKMSNDAFNYVVPRLKELRKIGEVVKAKDNELATLKSGKAVLPDSYLEHPQAFVLAPEYNEATRDLNTASSVQAHWQQQMENIRQGEPWQDLGLDAQGNVIPTKRYKADAKSEAHVFTNLQRAVNVVTSKQQEVFNIQRNFAAIHSEALRGVKDAETKYFGDLEKADHPLNPLVKEIITKFGPVHQKNPLLPFLAKSLAVNMGFQNQQKANEEKIKNQQAAQKTKSMAGPTEGDVSNSGGKVDTKAGEPTYDDFMNRLKGGW